MIVYPKTFNIHFFYQNTNHFICTYLLNLLFLILMDRYFLYLFTPCLQIILIIKTYRYSISYTYCNHFSLFLCRIIILIWFFFNLSLKSILIITIDQLRNLNLIFNIPTPTTYSTFTVINYQETSMVGCLDLVCLPKPYPNCSLPEIIVTLAGQHARGDGVVVVGIQGDDGWVHKRGGGVCLPEWVWTPTAQLVGNIRQFRWGLYFFDCACVFFARIYINYLRFKGYWDVIFLFCKIDHN